MWTVTIVGTPAPKGSMKCVGRNGRHQLVEQLAATVKPWRNLVKQAGERIVPIAAGALLEGPVSVEVTFTLDRPASVTLLKRPWPWKRNADVDKLVRTVLDGITDSGLWTDDSQVVELVARKTYTDTPGCVDRLDQPGAVLRIRKVLA